VIKILAYRLARGRDVAPEILFREHPIQVGLSEPQSATNELTDVFPLSVFGVAPA
jgi:hypothetical protein